MVTFSFTLGCTMSTFSVCIVISNLSQHHCYYKLLILSRAVTTVSESRSNAVSEFAFAICNTTSLSMRASSIHTFKYVTHLDCR